MDHMEKYWEENLELGKSYGQSVYSLTGDGLVGERAPVPVNLVALSPGELLVWSVAQVPAIVEGWFAGQAGGSAIADILFGNENPSGKLSETFPENMAHNPAHISYPGENGKVHYREGIFVGYRYYDKKEIKPLFSFGHGLSYTTFSYDSIRVEKKAYKDDETVHVYV
ncbi:glycoside hydrolase family 3 C-terminal domain-containing protein [Paenibacillus chitinolyticus]